MIDAEAWEEALLALDAPEMAALQPTLQLLAWLACPVCRKPREYNGWLLVCAEPHGPLSERVWLT